MKPRIDAAIFLSIFLTIISQNFRIIWAPVETIAIIIGSFIFYYIVSWIIEKLYQKSKDWKWYIWAIAEFFGAFFILLIIILIAFIFFKPLIIP